MKRVYAFLPATALFFILAGCNAGTSTGGTVDAPDAVAIPADGIELSLVANEGDTITYQAKMSMEGKGPAQPPMPAEYNVNADMKQTVKVTKVADGNITTETSFSDVKVTGTEMLVNFMKGSFENTKTTVTMDSKGRVVEQEGQMDANAMGGGSMYFPDKKVKVGDTWERSTPMPGGTGSMKAVYKFEGTEKVDGVDTAKISITPSTPQNNSKGSFTYWVDIKTGMAVKASGEIVTEEGENRMVMKMEMNKV
jgi:hypothetical protein